MIFRGHVGYVSDFYLNELYPTQSRNSVECTYILHVVANRKRLNRLRPPRCVSTGPVVVRLAAMAIERERLKTLFPVSHSAIGP